MAVTSATTVHTMTAADDAVTGKQIVKSMRWVGGSTAGHHCTVTDTAGNAVVDFICDAANFTDVHYFVEEFEGLIVTVLGSGTLYVYLM